MKIPLHINNLRLHYCINLNTKTTAHTIITKSRQTPIIHLFTTTCPYNHKNNTNFLKTNFIFSFVTTKEQKPSHLILSCPRILLFSKVVGNILTVSHNMVGGTLQIGTSVHEPPAHPCVKMFPKVL